MKERGRLGRKNYRSERSGLVMEKGKEISRDEMEKKKKEKVTE